MEKIALITVAILTGMLTFLTGCSLGPVATRDFNITDFNAVEAGAYFEVEIIPSETYSVSVTANDNLFNYILVSKSGNTLKLETRGINTSFGATIKARVTMPELRELKLSGATRGTALGFKTTGDFNLEVSGASRLDMQLETDKFAAAISGAGTLKGRLQASDSRIHLSGASHAGLDGSAGNTTLELSGASSAQMPDFTTGDAVTRLSGGSHASIQVTDKLGVHLSGGSVLEYTGNPILGDVDVSGGSNLRHK